MGKCNTITIISFILLLSGLILTGAGGYMDMTNQDKMDKIPITKQHLWNDGIILILISIYLLHFTKE